MSDEKIVSGIFFQIRMKGTGMIRRSTKWWIAFTILVGLTLTFISIIIGLGLRGNSGLGLEVVSGTFLVAFTLVIVVKVSRSKMKDEIISRRVGIVWLVGIAVAIILAVWPVSFLIDVERIIDLWQAFIVGGAILAVIPILMIEGYPLLKDRGPPGMLTIAGLIIVFAIAYMTVIAYWIMPHNPFTLDVGSNREPPSLEFPMGTTSVGQDMLSRVIGGGGIMFQVAIISVTVCFTIGVPIGLIASYRGGALDRIVSLVMDSIFAFPGLVLAIAIAAMLGPGAVNMALAIAVVYVPSYFRVIRSQVLTVRELPYVEAAIVMGARDRDILFRYILPNVLPSAVVIMSINFADAILTAAGLTFVGLGLGVEIADWGRDLTQGREDMFIGAWWVGSFPGIMIVLLALGFTLAGEGLNEILTPKLTE
ncbi:MAG: ABC transporter permease [Candidatus Thorarchaeota archaeon]